MENTIFRRREEKEGLEVPLRYLTNYIADVFYENKNEIIIKGGLK